MSAALKAIIVGNGHLGIIAAIGLAKLGVNVSIIDHSIRKQSFKSAQRLLALSKNSLDIINGFLNINLTDFGQAINFIRVLENGTNKYLDFDPQEINLDNFGCMIEEHVLNEVLLNHLENIPHIELISDFEITDIIDNGLDASIIGKDYSINADLILACDGKNSPIRQLLGIESHSKNYNQSALVCDISHELNHMGIALENFTPQGPFAILPKKGGFDSSIVWTLPNDLADSVLSLNAHDQLKLIKLRFGDHLGNINLKSDIQAYPLVLNYNTVYSSGRFYLLGDSLHSIHPLAGQGLNLSIRDYQFIAESVHQSIVLGLDIGNNAIISNYKKNRLLDNQIMIESTHLLNLIFSNNNNCLKKIRSYGLKIVNNMPLLKSYFMRYASGL